MPQLSKTDPILLVQRVLMLEQIRSIPLEFVKKNNPNIWKSWFEENEKGEEVEIIEIDWSYALFTSPNQELITLVGKWMEHSTKGNGETNKAGLIIPEAKKKLSNRNKQNKKG